MKYVWYIQDWNSMEVNEVFTTQKAARAKVKKDYGQGYFRTVDKGWSYEYFTPDDREYPACNLQKVPVTKATRKK